MLNRFEIAKIPDASEKERFDFYEEYQSKYGPHSVPVRNVWDKAWYKTVKIYSCDKFKACIFVNKKGFLELVSDPIIYSDNKDELVEILNNILSSVAYFQISDIMKPYCLKELFRIDGNYYCNVTETLEKYRSSKWLKSRKVDLADYRIKLVEYEKEKHYKICKALSKAWRKLMEKKTLVDGIPLGFKKFYNDLLLEKPYMECYKYKGLVLTYRNVPIMFRFYREINCIKGIMVDFENSLAPLIKNHQNFCEEYFKLALPIILEDRKKEVYVEVLDISNRINELEQSRIKFKELKKWNIVKSILKEIDDLKKLKEDTTLNWKKKEFDNFVKFVKNSCTNYNRKEFLEYIKTLGFDWYYEDGGEGPLIEYKTEKNDYVNNFYKG